MQDVCRIGTFSYHPILFYISGEAMRKSKTFSLGIMPLSRIVFVFSKLLPKRGRGEWWTPAVNEPRGFFVSAYANAPCPNMGRGRWRRRRDSNPRGLAPKRFSRPPRYDRFDTPAFPLYYIFPPPFCQTFFAFSPFFLRNPLDFICIMCYNTDDTNCIKQASARREEVKRWAGNSTYTRD